MAILGGALEQVGTGIAVRGKALREAKLKELEQEREFQFRSSQAGIGEDRADARALAGDQRQAAENEKNRAVQGTQYGTAADGTSVMIRDGKATTVTGVDGKPVTLASKAGDTPSEVATMEYLIKNGAAKNVQDAWRQVRQAKSDPDKSRAGIYKMWVTALSSAAMPPDDIQAEAMKRTEESMKMLGTSDDGSDAPDADGAATGGESSRGPGVMTRSDAVPADPAKRVVGKLYKAPNGKIAKWTGAGWELVQ